MKFGKKKKITWVELLSLKKLKVHCCNTEKANKEYHKRIEIKNFYWRKIFSPHENIIRIQTIKLNVVKIQSNIIYFIIWNFII